MAKKDQINRRVEDVMMYLSIIMNIESSGDAVAFNGVPVSDSVRYQAIDLVLVKLLSAVGITQEQFKKFCEEQTWKETSPEFREFNDIMGNAVRDINDAVNEQLESNK